MGVTVDVPPGVLKKARREWDEAAENLDGQWRRLHRVDTGGLSSEVVVAFERYRETWVDELKADHRKAVRFHEALEGVDADFTVTDTQEAERLRDLLPWRYRNATITDSP